MSDVTSPFIANGVLHGRAVADSVRDVLSKHVRRFANRGIVFRLVLVRVGDDPASASYVRAKTRACEKVGIRSDVVHLPASTPERELLDVLAALNADETVDGILVQLPLPPHIDDELIIDAVDPERDVDGFHPANLGLLLGRRALLQPCTPSGVMVLLDAAGVDLRGKRALVVGRSVIVGRPTAQLLCRADATVTIAHRHSKDLEGLVGEAEVLVVATGVPNLIKGSWVREGAVVIDVGINRIDGRLTGDVEFDEARKRASVITPVPGGVGPMTVAMLLWNTVLAGCARREDTDVLPHRPRLAGPVYPE